MAERLNGEELVALIERVFQPRSEDLAVAVIVDLPDGKVADNPAWRERREMVAGWVEQLDPMRERLGIPVHLYLYRNAHMNNADLPPGAWRHPGGPLPTTAEALEPAEVEPFAGVFSSHRIVIAPTEFSATAPLKLVARETGVRAATMPGFSASMIPALRLDYVEINRRVDLMTDLLTRAQSGSFLFRTYGSEEHALVLDLRYRTAHASGGMFPKGGVAGNLPSGESYIVPYEGEREGEPSQSEGDLPVQFGDEVVFYRIENNRAVAVGGEGAAREAEAERLVKEPAYGNLAELGLGVLSDFGLEPTGDTLLDEKLGLHIAFGRSDHFGGQVGAAQFSSPDAVVHIDRVYLPAIQPLVEVLKADLILEGGREVELMRDGVYTIDFGVDRI